MKKLKILTTLLLITIICMAFCTQVNAETKTYTITINNTLKETNHSYEAYQIFGGDLSKNGEDLILSNIVLGDGVDSESLKTNLKSENIITDDEILSDPEKLAEVLVGFGSDSENLIKFADCIGRTSLSTTKYSQSPDSPVTNDDYTVYTINNVKPGYYLIKDTIPGATENDTNQVYSLFILQVVGDATATTKSDVPTIAKNVSNKEDFSVENGWDEKTNTASVGDNVYFKLTAGLPGNMQGYKKYTFEIEDTLSEGFEFVEDSVKVKIGEKEISNVVTEGIYYTLTKANNVLTFDIKNLVKNLEAGDNAVTITYTAKLATTATRGVTANTNKAVLTYSNNPHDVSATGHTPETVTKTYTTDVHLHKIDKSKIEQYEDFNYDVKDGLLADAIFEVYAEDGKTLITTITTDENGYAKISGLKAGTYILKEINPPEGFNKLAGDITLVLSATKEGVWTSSFTASDTVKLNTPITNGERTDGTTDLNVSNKSGINLPSTGGIGTVIFTVVGISIMAISLIIAVRTNKKDGKSKR